MGVKFEDMDILDALGKIMELHTKHYKDDFDLDKELLAKLAVSEHTEDRRVLWSPDHAEPIPCGSGMFICRTATKTRYGTFTMSRQMIRSLRMP